MREDTVHLRLRSIGLTDARSGARVELGDLGGVHLLSLIRHRY